MGPPRFHYLTTYTTLVLFALLYGCSCEVALLQTGAVLWLVRKALCCPMIGQTSPVLSCDWSNKCCAILRVVRQVLYCFVIGQESPVLSCDWSGKPCAVLWLVRQELIQHEEYGGQNREAISRICHEVELLLSLTYNDQPTGICRPATHVLMCSIISLLCSLYALVYETICIRVGGPLYVVGCIIYLYIILVVSC
jgi:hypothetical protein